MKCNLLERHSIWRDISLYTGEQYSQRAIFFKTFFIFLMIVLFLAINICWAEYINMFIWPTLFFLLLHLCFLKLEDNSFTLLCWILPSTIQINHYIYIYLPSLFSFLPNVPPSNLSSLSQTWLSFVLHSNFPLAIYFYTW